MKLTPTVSLGSGVQGPLGDVVGPEHTHVYVKNAGRASMRQIAVVRDTGIDVVAEALKGHTDRIPGTGHEERLVRIVARLAEVFGDKVGSTYLSAIGRTKSEWAKAKNAKRATKRESPHDPR